EEGEREERSYDVEVDGRLISVKVIGDALGAGAAAPEAMRRPPKRESAGADSAAGGDGESLVSPIQGTILKVSVEEGAEVDEGELICVVEAMKMENEITAHRAGTVSSLSVSEGGSIGTGEVIAVIE
ncbi:MAG: biotin/lipoyl-containing protein, partial [Solirubrobacterales bacterium]